MLDNSDENRHMIFEPSVRSGIRGSKSNLQTYYEQIVLIISLSNTLVSSFLPKKEKGNERINEW